MIKRITRKVMKEVEETVSSVGICDICGKEFNYETLPYRQPMSSYYDITTGHHDWGNDSVDSVESRDACCDECLLKFIQEWLKNRSVTCSNTAYIDIHKDIHVLKKGSTNE